MLDRLGDEQVNETYMSKSHGTTFGVDFLPWKTENFFSSDSDDGECLVEFPKRNLVLRYTGRFEGKRDGKSGSSREIDWCTSSVRVA